jgi:putative ABC transport system ATP-binding protein
MLLEKVGIKEQWKKLPAELSGGQQQRISIARAIINDPPLILADEPTGNLDTKSANNVMQILGELNRKEGKTIILVTHNPKNTNWGNHVIYMKDGRIEKEEKRTFQDKFIKTKVLKESKAFETDRILNNFKGLSRDQIKLLITPFKTQALVDFLLFPYEEKQIKMIQEGIESFLMRRSDFFGLLEYLDKPLEEGGVGLDRRTAEKFLKKLKQILDVSFKINSAKTFDEKTAIITDYLLKRKTFKISKEATPRLQLLIKRRLLRKIDRPEFEKLLTTPFKRGGVGIDKRSARKIIRKIDLILLVSYGGSKNKESFNRQKDSQLFSFKKTPFE